MRCLSDDPRTTNCQVYLFLWTPFHLFDSLLRLPSLHPSPTRSDPLQCTFFHLNLIVTSYVSLKTLIGFPFFQYSPLYKSAKGGGLPGVRFLFAHRYRSQRRAISGQLSGFTMEAPVDPEKGARSLKADPYVTLL